MKHRELAIHLLCGLFCPLTLRAYTAEVQYDEIRSMLEKRHPKVEAKRFEVDASKIREDGYLKRSFLPSLELQFDQETFKKGLNSQKTQPSYSIEAKINLYNSDHDRIEADIRKLGTQVKEVQYKHALAEELLESRKVFWEIIYTQEKIDLLESMTRMNSTNSNSALKRIRNGVAAESDKVEFEIKAAELKQDLDQAKLRLKVLLEEFRLLIGLERNTPMQFPKNLKHTHDFEASLLHTHADHSLVTKEAELKAGISYLEGQSESRRWWPKIDAIAGARQLNEREEPDYPGLDQRKEFYIGLRFRMSVPEKLEFNNETQAKAKETQGHQRVADYNHQKLHAHFDSEVAELNLLHSQVHESEENITRAEKYFNLAQSEYARGVKSSPEMISAAEKLFSAKLKRLEILKTFNVRQAQILAKIDR